MNDLDTSAQVRAVVKREAQVLRDLLGRFTKDSDIVDGFAATSLGKTWSVGHARIFACWAAGAEKSKTDGEGKDRVVHSKHILICALGLEILLRKVVDVWTTPDHIKHSLLSGHQCMCVMD